MHDDHVWGVFLRKIGLLDFVTQIEDFLINMLAYFMTDLDLILYSLILKG